MTYAGPGPRGRRGGGARRRSGVPAFILLLSLFHAGAPAQETTQGFRRISVDDGLSQGTINAVFQDHKGFIWIGTLDGLNRFDGIEFKTYRHVPGDTASLSNSWITSIHEDGERRLWIGTYRGLNEFDRRTEKFRRYALGDSGGRGTIDYAVSGIRPAGDAGGSLLVVTDRAFTVPDRASGRLDSIARPGSGLPGRDAAASEGAWTWSRGVLYSVDISARRMTPVADFGLNFITSALSAGAGPAARLLVGSYEGLLIFDRSTGRVDTVGDLPFVHSMSADTGGGFWLGTGDGLWSLGRNGAGWRPARAGLDGKSIQSICRDSTGTVWVGTIDGLYRKQGSTPEFSVIRHREDNPNSLASNFVMPILEDRSGRIWFGTLDRGVSVMTPGGPGGGSFRNFPRRSPGRDGPWGNNIRSMIETRDGMVWMGTDAGLTLCGPGPEFIELHETTARPDSFGLWVDALLETRDGTLWAGVTGPRLVRVDRPRDGPPSFTSFPLLARIDVAQPYGVNVVAEGAGGALWVGAEGGLFRFDPRDGSMRHYFHGSDDATGLSNSFVWSLLVEETGGREVVWIGTSQGLNRFEPETGAWASFLAQDGFPNDWVYGILRDDAGRLWLTTNRGITCFDDRKPEGMKFRNYDVTDGIAGNECNRRSYARLRNGRIAFGGTQGVTIFDPNRLFDNRNAPPVVLTSVLNAGRRMDLGVDPADLRELRLGHDQNDLSFEFAALDYANPTKNEYAYRMEGHDRDWVFIGNRRFVSYAGLDPGRYVFRVKASNNDGVWNERGISLPVVIEPPYWQTWWFLGSGAAAVLLVVVGVFRAREKRAEEIFGIRRKMARDLHDEIGSNLTGIAVSGSLLKDSGPLTPDQEGRVADITAIAVRTSELMRDLIWVIRPENDRLDDLCFRMKDAAAGILGGTNCHFTMPADPSDGVLNLEVKHNLYLIYKEIITNIARHAKAREVTVALQVSGRTLLLEVTDDGAGFDTAAEAKGMGLKNLAARAAAIGGTLETRSAPGRGTRTTVSVPFT